jgi:hypothetical protein
MPTSLISTGVQFPDNSVQTTAATSGGGYAINAYATPGNFPAAPGRGVGLKLIKVTVVGGGGRGGNGISNPSGNAGGSGGGAGGAAIFVYPAPSLPASAIPYTVGVGGTVPSPPGGTTTFGAAPLTVVQATGGGPGAAQSPGGAGGVGSNGSGGLNFNGGAGAQGSTGQQNPGSTGGNSIFGGGGRGVGGNAVTYGAGGGGGQPPTQPSPVGLDGAPGVVIIEEFY